MGGYGSGRIGGKILTSQMTELDVRLLHRCGLLRKDVLFPLDQQLKGSNVLIRIDSQHLFLKYYFTDWTGESDPVSIYIKFDWTSCYFGGHRPWFLCPNCGRRAAILYGRKYFHCRICRDLAYPSENEPEPYRMLRKANKIRRRLKCEPGIQNSILFKPKGMHQTTFDRLLSQVHMLESKAVKHLFNKQIRN